MNERGELAEKHALKWLKSKRLTFIEKNYHCRFGEIDLIMLDQGILTFVEVRLRSNSQYGSAATSVTTKKQQKIITTANHFLMTKTQYAQFTCRFDVLAYESSNVLIEPIWYKDAFRL